MTSPKGTFPTVTFTKLTDKNAVLTKQYKIFIGRPVELYSSIQHTSLDDAEKLLEDFSAKIICDLDRMDEVDIL